MGLELAAQALSGFPNFVRKVVQAGFVEVRGRLCHGANASWSVSRRVQAKPALLLNGMTNLKKSDLGLSEAIRDVIF
jgi:hypothetical protein